jgi:16S rRNA (adenine(1408)-N(1))-methyltransferase
VRVCVAAYGRHGLRLTDARQATPAEIAASHSSWAKRLGAGSSQPVTLLRARAPGAPEALRIRSGDAADRAASSR